MASCAYGSCKLGTYKLRIFGQEEAELSQWEKLINHRGPYDTCKGVQLVVTALLGQVYGALSKVSILCRYHEAISY